MRFVCTGCGAEAGAAPYACPNAGQGDVDHVLSRDGGAAEWPADPSPNPFIRWRTHHYMYQAARAAGLSDADYVARVEALDAKVAAVAGTGFRVTPCTRQPGLSPSLGGCEVWVKDETGNVSGSHKGRHLMGVLIHLELENVPRDRVLAIASCGNAALAAATLARAAERPLRVFIPADAAEPVVAELRALGADLRVCVRQPGVAGDPCYHAFREAVAGGALPFTCQGGDNGLTIEGGRTLGWELGEQCPQIDRLLVQTGGGALLSAIAQGVGDAVRCGKMPHMPKIHAVQTEGAYPLARAFGAVQLRVSDDGATIDDALAYAATHRSEFMWPWEETPHSAAHGILDDETYDWYLDVAAMLRTDGRPVVVTEAQIAAACELGRRATSIDADETGTAGLAGALALVGEEMGHHEKVCVLFTGRRR